eukprot:s2691_g2.t1
MKEFDKAMAEKAALMADAEKCQNKLNMAQRLVGALAANGVIWEQTELVYIPGDTLVACSYASYVGVFTRQYREDTVDAFVQYLTKKGVPLGPKPDPLAVLATDAEMAAWAGWDLMGQGLPSDRVSCENGAILCNSQRWSLIIDPQLQGIVWIKNRESDNGLQVTRMGHSKILGHAMVDVGRVMLSTFEMSLDQGKPVLIENMGEGIDAVIMPVVSRNTIKRGNKRVVKLGDKEIVLNNSFKLFMQTKLSNPHYPPEIQAECTIINFTVTEDGLEDQLLFLVVKLERPDLAKKKSELIKQQNEFKARTLKAFTTAVSRVADVNRLSELHPDWLRRLVINDCWNGWRYQHNRLNKDKLEVLLDAGLDVDTPGLLFTAVWGSSSCLSLLLKRGADPLGDRARNPGHLGNLEQCPFVAAAEEREKLAQLRETWELKKALERHPKYAHRAAEEWRDAIERMHKNLLEMSGRRHYVKEKKWLRDEILQHVDKGYAVTLAHLEALLLEKLANAEGDILDDTELILSLEEAKKTSDEVKEKVVVAQETELKINETSEFYRPTGARGSLLFFQLMSLCNMHTFYKYSLDAYLMVVTRAVNSVTNPPVITTNRELITWGKPHRSRKEVKEEPKVDETTEAEGGEDEA